MNCCAPGGKKRELNLKCETCCVGLSFICRCIQGRLDTGETNEGGADIPEEGGKSMHKQEK